MSITPDFRTQSAPDFVASFTEVATNRVLGMFKTKQQTQPPVETASAPAVDTPPVQTDKPAPVRNGEEELKENLYDPHAEIRAQQLLEEISSNDDAEEVPAAVEADVEESSASEESKENSKVDDRQKSSVSSEEFRSQLESDKKQASSSANEAKKVLDSDKKRKKHHHHHHKHHHHKHHHKKS